MKALFSFRNNIDVEKEMAVDKVSVQSNPYQPRLIFDQKGLKEEIEKDWLFSDWSDLY